jgi:hypothetical protein
MLSGQLFGPGGNTTPEIGSMGSQYGLLQRRQSGKGCAVPVRCPSIPAISSLCAPSAWREESTQQRAQRTVLSACGRSPYNAAKDLVEITLRGDPLRTVTSDAPISWIWDVRPLKPGPVQVVLEVFSNVKVGNDEGRAQIRVLQDTWNVEATGFEWVKYQVAEIQPIWALLSAAATGAAGILAFFGIKGRKGARPRGEET